MKRTVAAALLVVAAGLVQAAAAAAPVGRLVLARDQDAYPVSSAQVLADPTNGLTIEGLRAQENEKRAAWETATRFNFGYTTARRWLKPGGLFAFIDSRPDPQSGAVDQPISPEPEVSGRRLADGREFRVVKVFYEPSELETELRRAGFASAEVRTTTRFFLLGRATA